jgi:hypothetical protein
MPAKAKVGSWLERNDSTDINEAYDSGSGSASGSDDDGEGAVDVTGGGAGSDSEEEQEEKVDRNEVIEWEVVLPKIRPALLDLSPKRREAFIARYLQVTESCTFRFPPVSPVILMRT